MAIDKTISTYYIHAHVPLVSLESVYLIYASEVKSSSKTVKIYDASVH